jgi:double zinc ribbon protein
VIVRPASLEAQREVSPVPARESCGAKFCEECGLQFSRRCGHCDAELSTSAKFCSECGRPAEVAPAHAIYLARLLHPKHLAEKILTSKAALEGERKQVTVLFADLKGSMLRLLPFVFGGRAGRMESSLWMGLLPSAGASVEIDTSRMAMLHLASRAIRDRGL